MSMYADYLAERTSDHIIETDQGFATYRFIGQDTCYIIDIYVKPEFRKRGVASDIATIIEMQAQEKGCSKIIGSVVPSAKNSTQSVQVLISYGMRLDSSANDFILFRKDI